ncbi:MAG: DUF3617 family protein [Betaproteobacteria bacterium]
MTMNRYLASVAVLFGMCLALPANAADRMRPGQWVGTTIVGGKTFPTSSCISQIEADAMNGDSKSVQAYVEKTIPREICRLTDFKVNGGQVIYTASCTGAPSKVITTSYHGDRSEGTDSTGGKTDAKLVGACK